MVQLHIITGLIEITGYGMMRGFQGVVGNILAKLTFPAWSLPKFQRLTLLIQSDVGSFSATEVRSASETRYSAN
ncbi:MAG: hypothetical protein CMF59_01030 [Leptospiraceae bacterium]|nr:hypothetical protein [Leptospiraceae bacterium]